MSRTPALAVVVIGRNEGRRLQRCLQSIQQMDSIAGEVELIYVDSNSTDGSRALAAEMGARVISLPSSHPTAALARNAGWRASQAPFILFLDGDTILDRRFVAAALEDFKPDTAVVCGNRREIHPENSIYNRVLDLDWTPRFGVVDYCGGDALIRRQALEVVGGYDGALIAGEEPEMCRRMRGAHWQILHVDRPMTGHDLAMTKWSQYWRRSIRTGYAYAEVSERFRGSALPFWEVEARHNRNRAWVLGIWATGTVLVSLLTRKPWPMAASLTLFGCLAVRSARRSEWKSPSLATRLLYGVHSHLQQIPIYLGQRQYWRDRQKGRIRGLMEYKETAP